MTGGLQKYCPDCAPAAIQAIDRQQSIAWNRAHVDYDKKREDRHAATAEIPCAICGKLFRPSGPARTCSPECAAELGRRTQAEWEATHKDQRREYHNGLHRAALAAMTPEELATHRDKVNASARASYAARQKKSK